MGADPRIAAINERLKGAGVPIRVRVVGAALYLRSSSLPPKPGDRPGKRYQLPQGPLGDLNLTKAESEAHRIWRLVVAERFKWADFLAPTDTATVGYWTERLKAYHLAHTDCSPETWAKHWERLVFSRLPTDQPLSPEILIAATLKTTADTWMRRQTCLKLARLAEFAGIEVDLSVYQGSYGRGKERARQLPTDDQILQWYDLIKSPRWKLIYARIVLFGLRPSEAFAFTSIDTYTAEVVDAKSGAIRITKAFHPHWAEQWPVTGELPPITWRDKSRAKDITDRISNQFRRSGINDCDRYDFRHAWCVRVSVEYEIPVEVAARWAGHSADVHQKTYARWLRHDQAERVYRLKAQGKAPTMPGPSAQTGD